MTNTAPAPGRIRVSTEGHVGTIVIDNPARRNALNFAMWTALGDALEGFTALITYYELEDVLSSAYSGKHPPLFLICDGITDVGNFGAMARTAACTAVNGLIIPQKGAATISGEAIKASAGALHEMPVCKVRFLDRAILYLQENGVKVVATDISATKWLHQTDLTVPTAIILGAEGKGVSPVFLKMADEKVKIPMIGDFNSFNVSVATGIVLYEAVRQRLGFS